MTATSLQAILSAFEQQQIEGACMLEMYCRVGGQQIIIIIIIIIYLFLTAIGFTPGGSSTAHIYTQTVHRIQRKEHI
jgi:hypothetical protein